MGGSPCTSPILGRDGLGTVGDFMDTLESGMKLSVSLRVRSRLDLAVLKPSFWKYGGDLDLDLSLRPIQQKCGGTGRRKHAGGRE